MRIIRRRAERPPAVSGGEVVHLGIGFERRSGNVIGFIKGLAAPLLPFPISGSTAWRLEIPIFRGPDPSRFQKAF